MPSARAPGVVAARGVEEEVWAKDVGLTGMGWLEEPSEDEGPI